ncbi:MAG: hypothetical protein JWP08_977, partial [Bryobacterales bacterium]|nr:hypothetical protein [Bryobacterales bacterium]
RLAARGGRRLRFYLAGQLHRIFGFRRSANRTVVMHHQAIQPGKRNCLDNVEHVRIASTVFE